nr:cytochrome P-450TYR=heme-thiolate enzyme {N-terminal} [Sorghum bicolor, Moench, hybrid S-1000, etiolated seedlings, Peptide Partial, 16 aa] [Sorghum bicolor]
ATMEVEAAAATVLAAP